MADASLFSIASNLFVESRSERESVERWSFKDAIAMAPLPASLADRLSSYLSLTIVALCVAISSAGSGRVNAARTLTAHLNVGP